jgi:hypothetical protein
MRRWLMVVLLALGGCGNGGGVPEGDFPVPRIAWAPRSYECKRTDAPPVIDGRLSDEIWRRMGVAWTEDFVDITGDPAKPPRFRTRAKMVWDDECLYVGVEMEEPHVWGSLTERDCVVYHDNDIELFLDPDGDTHEYYEFELNGLNTLWDLLVTKPYRDDGHGVNAWDVRGIRTAVHVDGTLNDPSDTDRGWSVEMAIPWGPLRESERAEGPPEVGAVWRMNCSRVEWRTKVVDGKYVKEDLPEDNWSWSPQGLVAMHYPEMWGFLVFSERVSGEIGIGGGPGEPNLETGEWDLRRVYYAQQRYRAARKRKGMYARTLGELGMKDAPSGVTMEGTANQFEAETRLDDGTILRITHDGRLRRIPKETD